MKKSITFLFMLNFSFSVSSYPPNNNLGQQLLRVANKRDPKEFKRMFEHVQSQYQKGRNGFFKTINARDQNGYNLLLFFSLIGDVENLSILFDGLKRVYKNDITSAFEYLNTRDRYGMGALGLAEYNGDRRLIEFILVRALDLLNNDKELFSNFLNEAESEHGTTALFRAARDNELDAVRIIVEIAATCLDQDSPLFKSFINAKNYEGETALSVSQGHPRTRFFLERYGATVALVKKENPEVNHATQRGHEVLKAAVSYELNHFTKLFNEGVEAFKHDLNLLYHFLSVADDYGWTVLIRMAAEGKLEYVTIILDVIDKYFGHEEELESFLLRRADFEGRTALRIAISRRHYKVAEYIFDKSIKIIDNRSILLAFLNEHSGLSGQTSFVNIGFASCDYDKESRDFFAMMIDRAQKVFGKDSRLYELFINAHDYNGRTALAYVTDDKIRDLLIKNGAVDTPEPEVKGIGTIREIELYECEKHTRY